jgi:hypothetical protein
MSSASTTYFTAAHRSQGTARQALDALYIPLIESALQNLEAAHEQIMRISVTESVVNEFTEAAANSAKKMYDDAHETYYNLREEYDALKQRADELDAADALLALSEAEDPDVLNTAMILESMSHS